MKIIFSADSLSRGATKTHFAGHWMLMLLLISVTVKAAQEGDFTYLENSTSITITSYTGSGGAVAIPDTIAGKPVATVGAWAFTRNSGVISVTIPNNVTSIGLGAFVDCTGLTSVIIGNSVTNIGDGAFRDCSSLTGMTIPNSVTTIGAVAFQGCAGLVSVNIPNSVTSIGNGAFYGCGRLTSITIPNGVTSLGTGLFSGCAGLASVNIPNSVTSIGYGAFYGCGRLTSVSIPNSVTTIDEHAFHGCSGLTSITIPPNVTTLGAHAFQNCTGLRNVMIGTGVTSIGHEAFSGCTGLTSITVDPLNAAYGSLEGVLFNKERTTLIAYPQGKAGNYATPDSVTTISSSAFSGCTGLTSVSIPDSVAGIGADAFQGCGALGSITVDPFNPIYSSMEGVLFDKDKTTLIQCPGGKVGTVTIPQSVISIGDRAFYGCTGLTSITVDPLNAAYSSVESVLFDKRQTLLVQYPGGRIGSYVVPNTVNSIGRFAFSGCTHLTSVTIPNSVTHIGHLAFGGCIRLRTVYFLGNRPRFDETLAGGGMGTVVRLPAFDDASGATAFYWSGSTGWDSFLELPAVLWVASDDLDSDRVNNLEEMLAGTDPLDGGSLLAFEAAPRSEALVEADQTAVPAGKHALYFHSIPGMRYEILSTEAIGGAWASVATVDATAPQKRALVDKPASAAFYRVRVAP